MTDRTRALKDLLWLLVFFGAIGILFRLWYGLGPTTNLSDPLPWGLWKIANMVAGVALATGGFTVGFLVYVLKLERFRPLVKPAILIAFLGYGSSCFALLLDIGLPHRIWHPIFMWNHHSFLFEVAWCVMLYFTVTAIELSPTLLERFKMEKAAHFLHRIAFGVVVVGISLSSLHHSSLGALFLVTPSRLHPLWYSPRLPIFFIISAMGAGLMVVVLAKMLYAKLYDPESVFGKPIRPSQGAVCAIGSEPREEGRDMPMLRAMAVIAACVLGVHLALRIADLIATRALGSLAAGTWESWFYAGELLLLGIVPVTLLAVPAARRSPAGLAIAASAAAAGLLWNRLNVGIFGYFQDAGAVYLPSLVEWAVGLGIFAAAGLAFLYVSETCSVFDDAWRERLSASAATVPSFDKLSGVWYRALSSGLHRITLLAVAALPLAWVFLGPQAAGTGRENPVSPPVALDAQRKVLWIDGDADRIGVTFAHASHKERQGRERSCGNCHHLTVPRDHSTPCYRCHASMEGVTRIFDHSKHFHAVARAEKLRGAIPANHSCAVCHKEGEAESAANAKRCMECHAKDMSPRHGPPETLQLRDACGYRGAMHRTCIRCHEKEAKAQSKPKLSTCTHCHGSFQPQSPAPAPEETLIAGTNSEAKPSLG